MLIGKVVLRFTSPSGAGAAALALAFASAGAGVGVAVCVVPVVEFKTETSPRMAGIEINSADSINTIAVTIVILDRTESVPRGPKAVLEILLVKSAPASVFPGCSKILAISTTQEIKNTAYKK